MDRIVRSPQVGRTPFSPFSRQNVGSSKILSSSFRKSSRMSLSGRSAQSVQILSSRNNYVERFGNPLPVHVTETLNHKDRNTYARISENGFAWVVRGRRLLIWQYRSREPQQRRGGSLTHCYELQLPQSDIAHRAELVSVTINNDSTSNTPSCMTVSPSGSVRFWPDVSHDDNFIDQQVTVQWEKCDSLTATYGNGWVLTTTSRTVMVLKPCFTNGRYQLFSECLKPPSGWLDRFGKRMTSLIFGSSDSYISENSGFLHVLCTANPDSSSNVYVMSDLCLQKWHLSCSFDLIYVVDLNRLIIEAFPRNLWDNRDHTEIDIKLMDLQNVGDCIVMLVAASNNQAISRVTYAMVWVQTNTSTQPTTLRAFRIVKIPEFYNDNTEGEAKNDFLSYNLLVNEGDAYIYNQKAITVIKEGEDVDTLVFDNPVHFILAGNFCFNTPVFFSNVEGLVSVYSKDMPGDVSLNVTSSNTPVESSLVDNGVINNLSIYNLEPEEMVAVHQDLLGQLKAAFIHHVKNEQAACKEILDDIFPIDGGKLTAIDSPLDKSVLMLATDLLDDKPAGDARWNKDIPLGLGSSYSMHISHQLRDKQRAYSLFIKFLKDSGLWNRLAVSIVRNTNIATVYVLGELSEKIVAALALKLAAKQDSILQKAIKKVVEYEANDGSDSLTHQDYFYREVSKIHCGLQELVNNLEDICHSAADPGKIAEEISETCSLYLHVLKDVMKFRNDNGNLFVPTRATLSVAPDYVPWTSANGSEGLADYLVLLHFLTYNYGIKILNNDRRRAELFEDLVGITDFLLDGRMRFIESIKGTPREKVTYKQFCIDRQKFLNPFVLERRWDKAAVLAEKYLDFETLMKICEDPENKSRLNDYEKRFSHLGFNEFSCNWYLKENQQGKLLDRCREKGGTTAELKPLHDFLSNYPLLQWMQLLTDEKYGQAAKVLKTVGDSEKNSVTKQKTAYSLCKMATLSDRSEGPDEELLKYVDSRLLLISFQEDIPDYVLQQIGYDTINQRPLSPKELVQLYVCKEYTEAGEVEFERALEICEFIEDAEKKSELSLLVWRSALLRDSWKHLENLDHPIEILQDKLFFKIVDLALSFDRDIISLLPPIEVLLDGDSLSELQNDKTVDFLLKAGYEYVYRMKSHYKS